jgi:hypothetical protein
MNSNRVYRFPVLSALTAVCLCACRTTPPATEQLPAQPVAAVEQQSVPGPAAGTAMTKGYVQMVGRMAYLWG